MKVLVNNFKGLSQVKIDLTHQINIIGGDNGAGKTSLLQAITSALIGGCPIKLAKKDYGILVRDGNDDAFIDVETATGTATIQFPTGKCKTTGTPPRLSLYSAGMFSPFDFEKNKDRFEFWCKILQSDPDENDLRNAINLTKNEDLIAKADYIVTLVKQLDYDGACAKIKEEGAKNKGAWQHVTGEDYGIKKASTWRPEGFTEDMNTESPTWQQNLETAKNNYEQSLKVLAVSENDRAMLEKFILRRPETEKALNELKKEQTEVVNAISRLKVKMQQLRDKLNAEKPLVCPHCSKPVMFKSNELVKFEEDKSINVKSIQVEIDTLGTNHSQNVSDYDSITKDISEHENTLKQIAEAEEKLKNISNEKISDNVAVENEKAITQYMAYTKYHEATKYQTEVMWIAEAYKILEPNGLRKQKVDFRLHEFNEKLAALCKVACWDIVKIDSDFDVYYDDRIYIVLSESEQYRVKATIQAVIGMIEKTDLFIFDRVDLLTRSGRNGLVDLCRYTGIKTILFLSASNKEELSKVGVYHWLENGTAQSVGV